MADPPPRLAAPVTRRTQRAPPAPSQRAPARWIRCSAALLAALWAPLALGASFEDALRDFHAGEYRRAAIELQNVLQAEPQRLAARVLLARVHMRLGEAAAAEKELRRARAMGAHDSQILVPLAGVYLVQRKFESLLREIVPGERDLDTERAVHNLRGRAQLELHRLAEAEREFRAAALLAPGDSASRLGLAMIALRRGDDGEASRLADESIALEPRNAQAHYLLAEVRRTQRRLDLALAGYEQALAIDPQFREARRGRAAVLLDLGEHAASLSELDRLLESDPADPQAAFLKAMLLARSERTEEARQLLQEVSRNLLSIDAETVSDHGPSLLLLGAVSFANGELEAAYTHLIRYIDLFPRHTPARKMAGAVLIGRGEPLAAIDLMQPALAWSAGDAKLHALLARALTDANQHVAAARMYEKAVELAPEAVGLRTELALAKLRSGEAGAAAQDLESVLGLSGDGRRPGLLLGQLHLRAGRHAEARRVAEALLDADPSSTLALNLLAGALLGGGDLSGARAALERTLAQAPEFHPAAINLARLDAQAGDAGAARARLEQLLERSPSFVPALSDLARLELRQGRLARGIELLEKARSVERDAIAEQILLLGGYLQAGRTLDALDAAARLETVAPDSVPVLLAAARAQQAAGERSRASATLARASRYAGRSRNLLLMVARDQALLADHDAARWSLDKLLAAHPDDAEALLARARLEVTAGEMAAAMAAADRLIAAHPSRVDGHLMRAEILERERKLPAALAALAGVAERDRSGRALIGRYRILLAIGKGADGLAELERFLAQAPDHPRVRRAHALALARAGRSRDAAEAYEWLLAREPDNAVLLNNLAYQYHALGDPRALATAEKAHRLSPDSPAALDTFGWLLVQNGEPERGLALLREAQSRTARDPRVMHHIAEALVRLDRRSEAKQVLREALARGEFEGRAEAQALMRRL